MRTPPWANAGVRGAVRVSRSAVLSFPTFDRAPEWLNALVALLADQRRRALVSMVSTGQLHTQSGRPCDS